MELVHLGPQLTEVIRRNFEDRGKAHLRDFLGNQKSSTKNLHGYTVIVRKDSKKIGPKKGTRNYVNEPNILAQ